MTHRSNSVGTNKGGKHPILIPTRKKRLHWLLKKKRDRKRKKEKT